MLIFHLSSSALEGKKIGCMDCKAPQALFCCTLCRKYHCAKCDKEKHKSDATKKHPRFKVGKFLST
jgi:hypothetical protein